MRVSNLVGAFILWLCMPYGFADTPPPPMHAEPGPDGTRIPYFNQYAYAYIGKVVGYSENEWKDSALEVQVLDAWTPMQKNGDVLTVAVRGDFDPHKYPIGTRVRVICFSRVIDRSDAHLALVVLGVAP